MARKIEARELETFIRQLYWLIGGLILLVIAPLVIHGLYLDRRLDLLSGSLKPNTPEELASTEAEDNGRDRLEVNPVDGQTVYVPAYSHIYHEEGKPHLLTITLSVRNTIRDQAIIVNSVRYFDTKGEEVKSYLDRPVRLPAMGTTEVIVEREDSSGGSGANFLVDWSAGQPVSAPVIEAVMIDTKRQQGISFARRGFVVSKVVKQPPSAVAETPSD